MIPQAGQGQFDHVYLPAPSAGSIRNSASTQTPGNTVPLKGDFDDTLAGKPIVARATGAGDP